MSDNKKYYYMRLKENFFNSEEIVLLESMPDGYLYSNVLLKLYLISLKNDGRLMFNEMIPYNAQMIATLTRHQLGTVEKALDLFEQLGLIEVLTNGAIYMLNIQELIGKSSEEADRKREFRARIDAEKESLINCNNSKKSKIGTNVQTNDGQMSDNHPPEIEIEIEIEKEIKIDRADISAIVEYLNEKTGKSFKPDSKETVKHIKARMKEGFTIEDFKTVIDKKTRAWLKDPKMNDFLRPQTLFGTKFEGYLNEEWKAVTTKDIASAIDWTTYMD